MWKRSKALEASRSGGAFVTEYLRQTYDWTDPDLVSIYDELALWSAMFGSVLLRHVELRPRMKVLDVGCGTGFPLLELAPSI